MDYHKPVLLNECIEGLNINPLGIYVDSTYGSGGHAKAILKHLTTGKLIAFDQDEDAMKNKINDERLILINQNFKYLKNYLKLYNALPVDGILADLGVSSHQFDTEERGFSTRFDAELDMRMDKKSKKTAKDILNNYAEQDLKRILKEYGEVENSTKIARLIVHVRKLKPLQRIAEFKLAISPCLKKGKENQYYAQVFQALRIEVNNEIETLKEMLIQSRDVLKTNGRLVVVSYHSLEDRLVKNFTRTGKFEGDVEKDFFGNPIVPFKILNRKPIIPTVEEVEMNSRARSAKLRIAEKI